jgi:hypothetical protein
VLSTHVEYSSPVASWISARCNRVNFFKLVGWPKKRITLCVCGCYGGKNHWTILPTRVFIFARREHVLHPSIGLAGPTAGGSPDVVLCPALAPFIADRLRGVLRC